MVAKKGEVMVKTIYLNCNGKKLSARDFRSLREGDLLVYDNAYEEAWHAKGVLYRRRLPVPHIIHIAGQSYPMKLYGKSKLGEMMANQKSQLKKFMGEGNSKPNKNKKHCR